MPLGCCPFAANSIISFQFWKVIHWLPVEQRIEYKVLLLTYKALYGKAPAYISQLLSLYAPSRPLRSEYQDAVWKSLVDAALHMPLHSFGTLSLHLLNLPLPLIPSRAAWRLTYLMRHILRSTDFYIVWVYCLWLFQCFLHTSAFKHGDFSPFLKVALCKCSIIIHYHYY